MSILRTCPPALALALAGGVPVWSANIVTFTLADGITTINVTDWERDLTSDGITYLSKAPWISFGAWSVANTMEVATLKIKLAALNGGAQIKTQIHDGLFDGAACNVQMAFMPSPGDITSLGAVTYFGDGEVGAIDSLTGSEADITLVSKAFKLDQMVPRKVYQVGCNWAFCDVNCTLNRASFTASYVVGTSPTTQFIPWGTAPANPSLYIKGSIAITSGDGAGQRRTIANADSTGIYPVYPFFIAPSTGDAFTAFQGCDKTFDSGSGRSCTDRSNTQNYDGFEFVPPPNAAY